MTNTLKNEIIELSRSNKLYKEILDRVMHGVYIVNAKRQIVWFNSLMQKIDGINREEVIGKHEESVFQSINNNVSTVADVLRTGKISKAKLLPYTTKTGRKVNAFMQSFPVYYDNNLEYVYMVIDYIDYSKKAVGRKISYDSKIRISNDTVFTLDNVLGSSKQICEVVANARKVALRKSPVLLHGQTGTGKEIFAQGIHNASLHNKGRFVAINCATIPENLMETILFGSVKGAYTGALDKPGLLEEANNGTLFLDELNSLPLTLQSKLLRVLQEKQACRIGDNRNYLVNCRIISATNQDTHHMVANGILRQDLYFRLAVITLEIPPLAKRKEDIPELIEHFIKIYNEEFDLQIKTIDPAVLDVFYKYSWPGNVRELEHAIEYMMNFVDAQSQSLSIQELPSNLKKLLSDRHKVREDYSNYSRDVGNLHQALKEFEKEYLKNTLEQTQWNISQAARILGIHREALYYRIKKFGLKKDLTM
jgi:arginine utilization regulatory protein